MLYKQQMDDVSRSATPAVTFNVNITTSTYKKKSLKKKKITYQIHANPDLIKLDQLDPQIKVSLHVKLPLVQLD